MEQHEAPHGPLATARLANGLTVVAQHDSVLQDVHVHLRYEAGSRHEQPGQHGLAHLLEHLMFAGTPRYPDYLGALRRGGAGEVNASADQDRSSFTMTVPRRLLPQALAMEADRMTALPDSLDRAALSEHLALVRQEDLERHGQPFGDATRRLFGLAMPPGHPYRHASMGDTEALGRLTPETVACFHRQHYRPERATLVILGDVPPEQSVEAAARAFGGVTPSGPPPPPETTPPVLRGDVPPEVAACPQNAAPRVYTLLHTPPYGEEQHAAYAVLAAVLGLGRGSRLFRSAVREAGAARPGGEMLAAWELEAGSSVLFGTVGAAPGVPGGRLLETVRTALAAVADGVTADEAGRAVRLVGRQCLSKLDGPASRAKALAAHARLEGAAHRCYARPETVAAVTADDVEKAAGTCLSSAAFLVYDADRPVPGAGT